MGWSNPKGFYGRNIKKAVRSGQTTKRINKVERGILLKQEESIYMQNRNGEDAILKGSEAKTTPGMRE